MLCAAASLFVENAEKSVEALGQAYLRQGTSYQQRDTDQDPDPYQAP